MNFLESVGRSGLVILVVIFLSACAARISMSELDLPLDRAQVIIVANQQQIEPNLDTREGSYGAAYGFAGFIGLAVVGLANYNNNQQAEVFILHMQERLRDIDLGAIYSSRIVESDVFDLLSHDTTFDVLREVPEDDDAFPDAWFLIHPSVQMAHDMRTLLVTLDLSYLTKSTERVFSSRVEFSHRYQFAWPVRESDFIRLSRERAVAAWADWSDEELVQLIDDGITTTLRMMHETLLDPYPETQRERLTPVTVPLFSVARIWQVDDDAVWLTQSQMTPNQGRFRGYYAMPRSTLRRAN